MHCNGCQTEAPHASQAELVDAGWCIDEIPATRDRAHPETPRSPASKLYYCPTCAVELDHSKEDAAPLTPRDLTVIEGSPMEPTPAKKKKR